MLIAIQDITPNPMQPRTVLNADELTDLAETLRADGLLNAICVVGPVDGVYMLLDGERRWRAAQLAGWTHIEATVREPNWNNGDGDKALLLLAMIGNLQRSDMGPIDEANGYKRLLTMGMSITEIADRVGRSISNVSSRLKMLNFPEPVQDLFNQKRLPIDERVFSALRKIDEDSQIRVAQRAAAMKFGSGRIIALCSRIENGSSGRHSMSVIRGKQNDGEAPALAMNAEVTAVSVERLRIAVRLECKECGMYDDIKLCRTCPLVKFIALLSAEK